MRPVVGAIQSEFVHPVSKNPRVLPSPQVRRIVQPAWEQEIIRFQRCQLDPCLQRVSGCCGDLELHRSLRFVLHDDGSRGQLVSETHITNLEGHEVATT